MSYVYESQEVEKTGREAIRELKGPTGSVIRTLIQVEIKPVDDTFSWKKWVDPSQLYIIKENDK